MIFYYREKHIILRAFKIKTYIMRTILIVFQYFITCSKIFHSSLILSFWIIFLLLHQFLLRHTFLRSLWKWNDIILVIYVILITKLNKIMYSTALRFSNVLQMHEGTVITSIISCFLSRRFYFYTKSRVTTNIL